MTEVCTPCDAPNHDYQPRMVHIRSRVLTRVTCANRLWSFRPSLGPPTVPWVGHFIHLRQEPRGRFRRLVAGLDRVALADYDMLVSPLVFLKAILQDAAEATLSLSASNTGFARAFADTFMLGVQL